jgi:hypothetical protein
MTSRSIWVPSTVIAAGLAAVAWALPRGAPTMAPKPAQGAAAPQASKVALFNGKDLAGWKTHLQEPNADPAKTWTVKDGILQCTGTPAGYIRTEQTFKNYFLVVEWRWPVNAGNSGVLLHMQREDRVWPYSVEAQLHSGNAGDFWLIDGATAIVEEARRNPGSPNNVKHLTAAENRLGEWNRYEITCLDGNVVLVINGQLVNVARNATPNEGWICLQSEGAPIEFREVSLTPIP